MHRNVGRPPSLNLASWASAAQGTHPGANVALGIEQGSLYCMLRTWVWPSHMYVYIPTPVDNAIVRARLVVPSSTAGPLNGIPLLWLDRKSVCQHCRCYPVLPNRHDNVYLPPRQPRTTLDLVSKIVVRLHSTDWWQWLYTSRKPYQDIFQVAKHWPERRR